MTMIFVYVHCRSIMTRSSANENVSPMCLNMLSRNTPMVQMKNQQVKSKRVQVTFTEEQWRIISKMRGSLGGSDADTVRNIVLAWLAEKSFISESAKKARDTQ